MAKNTHALMSSALAKALIESGVHHFDAGGTIPGQATTSNPSVNGSYSNALTSNPVANGATWGLSGQAGNIVGSGAQAAGGVMGGIAADFTNQNQYQADLAPTDYTSYGSTIQAAGQNALNGYGTAQTVQQQQEQLANALMAQSQGQGPNPAQAQLNQTTGQNVQSQAALAAGQRGSGANVGEISRQAAQTGATTQQNAVGQAATLEAQQQLAAEQGLAQQQSTIGSQNIAEQGVNNSLLSTAAGAQNTQNNSEIQNYNMAQGINSQVAQNNSNAVNKTEGGLMNGAGSLLSMLSKGGRVGAPEHLKSLAKIYYPHKMADGGGVGDSTQVDVPEVQGPPADSSSSGGGSRGGSGAGLLGLLALLKDGGKVPGKAKVKGNSSKNDTQLALLSPDEEVLPRTVTMAPDAPKRAAEFVQHLQETEGKKSPQKSGYDSVVMSKKSLKDRVAKLEKMMSGGRV